jgi:hypothetical protein
MGMAAFFGMCLIWREQDEASIRHSRYRSTGGWTFFRRRQSNSFDIYRPALSNTSRRKSSHLMTQRDRKVAECRRL